MSLPAWNRKAPSRAVIAATLSAFAVFGASSVAIADVNQQQPHGQQPHSAPAYGQPAPGYGFPGTQPQGGYANYGFAAPAPQGYGAPAPFAGYGAPVAASAVASAPQGYAAPVQQLPVQQAYGAPAQVQAPGYGQPQPFPGYGLPGQFDPAAIAGGFPVPGAPAYGFNPYGGGFGQWGNFAPSEPNYAPHERARSKAAVAPAAPAPKAPTAASASTRPVAVASSADYSYQIAPTGGSTYVGNSKQIKPSTSTTTYADPYQTLQQGYQAVTPSYTQSYDAQSYDAATTTYADPAPQQTYTTAQPTYAPAATQTYAAPQYAEPQQQTYAAPQYVEPQQQTYAAPQQQTYAAPEPSQNYVAAPQNYDAFATPSQQTYTTAPAPQTQQNVGGYEYQSVQQPSADYYDLSAQTAAAALSQQQQVAAYAPQQVAPVGGHFVQVGAFIDPNRANRLVNKLASSGEQAFVVPAQVRGKLYHRVRIASGSKRDARAVRNRVRDLGYYEARVVKG